MSELPVFDPSLIPMLLPFDPFDASVHADPYPTYHKIRDEHGAVYRSPAGMVSTFSHEAASVVLKSPDFGWGDNPMLADQMVRDPDAPDGPPRRILMFMDPPDHTRVRGLVSQAFTPRTVEWLRPRAHRFVESLISDALAARDASGVVDLHKTVISPLPGLVLSELLKVPAKYHADFLTYFRDSGIGIDPAFLLTPEQVRARDDARAGFMAAGMEMAAERLADPGEDLVSRLALAEQDGDRLSRAELALTLMNLLAAGFGATVAMIANCMLGLLRHPAQLRWLRDNPDKIAGAVEELTRYDSPLQMTFRSALRDTELAGVQLAAGQPVMVVLGAANHDPAAYQSPDVLDLSRTSGKNLGFGHGIHFCVAAPIARLTAQVAISAFAAREIELADHDPARPPGMVLRTIDELPVKLGDPI
ncbi:cytochrome P450 [Sphaerisporangium flaviroseum]